MSDKCHIISILSTLELVTPEDESILSLAMFRIKINNKNVTYQIDVLVSFPNLELIYEFCQDNTSANLEHGNENTL